jgi:hypothetical protein
MKRKVLRNGKGNAWVIAVSMGYGHQRTAYPLRDLSPDGTVLNANDYDGIPDWDRKIWKDATRFYGAISRFTRVPFVGPLVFGLYNRLQRIVDLYPTRDLSKPTGSLREIFSFIKKGWGRDWVDRFARTPVPLVTTFFMTAFMAEYFHYPGDIFCVTADADVARDWAPLDPARTKIHYCASTSRVAERLAVYGVPKENIHLTGYPLPKENIGGPAMKMLAHDMRLRLANLDPQGNHTRDYQPVIAKNFGRLPRKSGRPLTIMFSIGGAGAQKEIGIAIVRSLAPHIKNGEVAVILAAGVGQESQDHFIAAFRSMGFDGSPGSGIEIVGAADLGEYFARFNEALRRTDILWTKPSELSFYCALGIPIIMAPTIGSQEDLNREWLLTVGAGMDQYDPAYTHEWLFDYLHNGWFAEAAMHGFLDAEKMGVYAIEHLIKGSG